MTTRRPQTEHDAGERRHAARRCPPHRDARSVTAAEMLAILAPTPDEPEGIRHTYLWKTGQPTPSAQPSVA